MNTSHKNDGASFRNKDQTGVGHARPSGNLNSGEDILLQEGLIRKLRAQQIRVHKMAEFEKSCDAIFPGIRREIIALSKSAEFVAVQEMKAAEMKGDDFSDIVIYTPFPTSASQEFMMVTPEPASMMLFGTGLLVIGAAIRRRRAMTACASKEA